MRVQQEIPPGPIPSGRSLKSPISLSPLFSRTQGLTLTIQKQATGVILSHHRHTLLKPGTRRQKKSELRIHRPVIVSKENLKPGQVEHTCHPSAKGG